MTARFDAIIIGTGQAGPFPAQRLAAAGQKGRYRGTQVVRRHLRQHGLHPTKTMVASAYAAHIARRPADFGVTIAGTVSSGSKSG